MVPSFVMFVCALTLFVTSIVFHSNIKMFTKSKQYEKAAAHALFSIIFAIISGAVLIGAYLVYVAEHTLK